MITTSIVNLPIFIQSCRGHRDEYRKGGRVDNNLIPTIRQSDPAALAQLLQPNITDHPPWDEGDLWAILQHQLAAPLAFELDDELRQQTEQTMISSGIRHDEPDCYGTLLAGHSPPVDQLRAMKNFAKACMKRQDAPLPDQVAGVIYYGSIAAALVNCSTRISQLTDDDLRTGFHWVLEKKWVDADVRTLIEAALQAL